MNRTTQPVPKNDDRPSTILIWITAARPHTLTASISPCIVVWAITRPPLLPHFLLWLVFCVTIQIGTNLHNDYADFVLGADTEKRVGPPRATAKGWLTPRQTCQASTGTLTITLAAGIALLWSAGTGQEWHHAVFLWLMILSSIFNAFAYTGGPYPLGYLGLPHDWSIGYAGLGEVFVFLYFGLVATLMLPYLLSINNKNEDNREQRSVVIDWTEQWICATQMGLLAINIIVVNNLRDRLTDVQAGKRTTAVRFGRRFCEVEYMVCNILAFALVVVNAVVVVHNNDIGHSSSSSSSSSQWRPRKLLPLLSALPAFRETLCVLRKEGPDLNVHVGGAAKVQLLFAILVALGSAGS
jgi:1,4-dihydroxy-2-naphthoate polyprenyltransferase